MPLFLLYYKSMRQIAKQNLGVLASFVMMISFNPFITFASSLVVFIIRKYRIQKGWSQMQLSDAVNMDRAEISRIENGDRGAMSCTALRRFARALGVSMDELMGEDEGKNDAFVQHQRKFEQLDANNQSIIDQMTDALLLKQRVVTA